MFCLGQEDQNILPEASEEKILVLIPAYDEADGVAEVVQAALHYLPVLVVDDGSRDDTPMRAEAAGAVVLRQHPNQGKGTALKTGFRWALDEGYAAVLTLDADGQHDPAEIPLFLQAYRVEGADLIIGQRDFSHMPPIRRFSNCFGRHSFSWALRSNIPDNQSGYRLISQRLIGALLDSPIGGFEFEVEMIVICVRRGYKLAWVPIRTIYAGEHSHIHPWTHTKNFFRMLWETRRSDG
jgi:glycosyltransferase involved in cell wall biosynthesis